MDKEIENERIIDEICNDFETQWTSTDRSDISSLVKNANESIRSELLQNLVEVDIELRGKLGERVGIEDYRQELAELPEFDAAMQERVAQQLKSNSNAETRLSADAPTRPMGGPAVVDEIPGFQLQAEIGQGGMGTVWQAEQFEPVRRKVAVKVVRAELSSHDVIARFEAERQALALMDHDNIARIFDGGVTVRKQPWFAMEFVDGRPVVEYCDQNRLSIENRLQLCIQICRAVQHAHQKGIIHRDLKPSNVLVTESDGQPVVKVIDFGLAKEWEAQRSLTDKSLSTEFGQVLGTIQYMSPEQAAANPLQGIDTRADIYSIGILLYELLTGTTPLQTGELRDKSVVEMLAAVRDLDVVAPSSRLQSMEQAERLNVAGRCGVDPGRLMSALSGDLDWVVMKALEKERSRRYGSVSELAADLQRFLNDEPVLARPPSLGYRARKFVRKNRVAVVVASLLIAVLAIGFATTTWQMFRALDAEELAENRRIDAEKSQKKTEASLAIARDQNELAYNTLLSVISDIQSGLKNIPGGAAIRRKILDRTVEQLQQVTNEYVDKTSVDSQSVTALNELGDIALTLREIAPTANGNQEANVNALATSFYKRAHEIATEIALVESENIEYQKLLAVTKQRLGDFYLKMGQTDQATQYVNDQFRLSSQLVSLDPANAETRMMLATAHDQKGDFLRIRQQVSEALEQYETARDIRLRLWEDAPDNALNQRQLARSQIRLNEVFLQLGRIDDGLVQLNNGHETLRKLIQQAPENAAYKRDLLVALEREGDIQQALRKNEEAHSSYGESMELATTLLDLEPDNLEYMMTKSLSHQKLARLLLSEEKLDAALEHYRQSMQLDEAILQVNPLDTMATDGMAVSLGKRGEIYLQKNQPDKAYEDFHKSMELRKGVVDKDPNNLTLAKKLSVSYQRLGRYFQSTGDLESAFENHMESYRICRRLADLDPGNDSAQRFVYVNHEYLALVYEAKGESDQAVVELEKMMNIAKARADRLPTHPGVCRDYLYSCLRLGQTLHDVQQLDRSMELCRESVRHADAFLENAPNDEIVQMKSLLVSCRAMASLRKRAWQDWDELPKPGSFDENELTDIAEVHLPSVTIPALIEYRVDGLLSEAEFVRAAETAKAFSEMESASAEEQFGAAKWLAQCAAGYQQANHSELSTEEQGKIDSWNRLAIEILAKAIESGWDDFDRLKTDPALKQLQEMPEFQALIPE